VKRGVILCLGLQAYINLYQGDVDSAQLFTRDCLAMATEIKAPRPIAYCKEVYGLLAYARDDYDEAHALLKESLEIFEKVGDRRNVTSARINLARIAYRQGNLAIAEDILQDCLALSRALDIRWVVSYALEILGLVERCNGELEYAYKLFHESLIMSVEQDNQQGIANCLGGLAGVEMLANRPRQSMRLFTAADRIRKEINAKMGNPDRREYEHFLDELHRQMDETAFQEHGRRKCNVDKL
jgi:tetratricopeptide (TPR) repeat protein